MSVTSTSPQVQHAIRITIDREELEAKIPPASRRPPLLAAIDQALEQAAGCWRPALVYRWLSPSPSTADDEAIALDTGAGGIRFNLGHSRRFIASADRVLVAAYTIGDALEEEGAKATAAQYYLNSYLFDLMGLIALEKTASVVKKLAEDEAARLGWGVSPFLSPGSVHGWDLAEQEVLCSLLPLHEIGVALRDSTVLTPFKSLACMIGIGAGYDTSRVGSTCQVCAGRDTCQLRADTSTV